MSSIGESLRRERRRRNLELDQISHELRISTRFLEAIEDEQFDRLPAGVFAKSFVRQYARYLGLDEEELAGEVQRVLEPPPPIVEAGAPRVAPIADIHVPRVDQWETVGDSRRFDWSSWLPSLALVVVVMLVCSGVYSFWQRGRRPVSAQISPPPAVAVPPAVAPSQPEPVPPAETQPAAPAPEPAPPQATAQAPEATSPSAAAPPKVTSPPAQAPPKVISPAAQAPPSANRSADRPAPDVPQQQEASRAANPKGTVRVELTAKEPVWVLARTGGKYLFSGTLEPNQTRSVESNGPLLLRLGNAGGVNITLNGKPLGAVGPKGQVRDVQFTSGGFQVMAAPKSSVDNPI